MNVIVISEYGPGAGESYPANSKKMCRERQCNMLPAWQLMPRIQHVLCTHYFTDKGSSDRGTIAPQQR